MSPTLGITDTWVWIGEKKQDWTDFAISKNYALEDIPVGSVIGYDINTVYNNSN